MLPPDKMCRNHLLGEHKELHQLVGALLKGRMNVVLGHARLNQIETKSIISRHDELVEEMKKRGYNHRSPLPEFDPVDIGKVNLEENLKDLCSRCETCRALNA